MDADSPSDGVVHGHKVEFARQRLREAILSGQFAPGASMKQTELADALEVGRTPLREAIRVVQEEGLLVSAPNRTVRVAGFSTRDLEGLYALRVVHEAAMVRITVPGLSPEEVGELRALMTKMEHFASEEDFNRYAVPHRAFHTMLISGHGERALAMSAMFFDHAARYVRAYAVSGPGRYELADHEHRAILEAAIDRDASRCARAIVAHYVRTAAGVIEQLDPQAELPRLHLATAIALGEPDLAAGAALWQHAREQHRQLPDAP